MCDSVITKNRAEKFGWKKSWKFSTFLAALFTENLRASQILCQYQQIIFNMTDNEHLCGEILTGLSDEVIINFIK